MYLRHTAIITLPGVDLDFYPSRQAFSSASISLSLIETSRVKSGQRTFPEASVEMLNLFWQSLRQAHIEQYFFSVDIIPPWRFAVF